VLVGGYIQKKLYFRRKKILHFDEKRDGFIHGLFVEQFWKRYG